MLRDFLVSVLSADGQADDKEEDDSQRARASPTQQAGLSDEFLLLGLMSRLLV